MNTIQLFVDSTPDTTPTYSRVELFKDESVTITDSIQNIKDIAKVFTSFSKSFSVPASKSNNKLFKHFNNSDIDLAFSFDARKKVKAIIELNNAPFKTGKVKLEGVNLKNNKPHTYRITFFGDIVELKDKLGEKKLSDLSGLSAYNIGYDASTIETKLTTAESSSNNIIVPLITHSQRLTFDSGSDVADSGNLSTHGSANRGVKFNELKYALRVNKIIETIETDLGLSFSSDFFKNTSKPEFDHLFMWLHRKSGAVEDLSGSTLTFETTIDGWTPVTAARSGEPYTFVLTDTTLTSNVPTFGLTSGSSASAPTARGLVTFKCTLTTSDSDAYDVAMYRDGQPVFTKSNHQGSIEISGTSTGSGTNTFAYAPGSYSIVITATSQISFTSIIWNADYKVPKRPDIEIDNSNGSTGAYNTSSSFQFNVDKQVPEIKIIDFLTGLFKLFNLTAFVENDVIQVKPLDDFYENPTTYDITEFVDVNDTSVDAALPFKEVLFKFKDTKTFLANKYSELNNKTWGETNYNQGQDLSQGQYKVEAPFGHMLFERLTDVNGGAQKNIQVGYNVDSNQSPYLGSPLLFYPVRTFTSGISFVDAVDQNNVATSHKSIGYVNLPFNSVSGSSAINNTQLNFAAEQSEYTGDSSFTNSLFEKYYKNYILSVFNTQQRLTKVKAFLPKKILLNFNLGDRFIIAGSKYKINTISTNLATGESKIELLNDL